MRLDRALLADARLAWRSRSIRLYLLLQLAAGGVFVARRGAPTASMVVLIWLGLLVLAFVAWWAGRHRLAHPQPDPAPAAGPRAALALTGVATATAVGFGLDLRIGFVIMACVVGGWLWAAWRAAALANLDRQLTRDPRPFVPLLLLVALPRLVAGGPAFLAGAAVALPSGIVQQSLYLLGMYAPLEALGSGRSRSAVVAALAFALVHVPTVLEANEGDLLAAVANAVLFQSGVGLVACLAYQRHRAAVPIGVAHALAIG